MLHPKVADIYKILVYCYSNICYIKYGLHIISITEAHMMKEGLQWIEEKVVEESELAINMKSGTLRVFSTPSMIALMEHTSWKCVEQKLESGQTTVGVHVKTDHLKATLKGKKIKCVSTLKEVHDKKLMFYIEVFEGDTLIGKAEHTRFIVDTERFLSKLNS